MHFGPVRAVDGVSLTIPRGGVTALVGESGSGKSTVGRCVVRLLKPTGGVVRIGGVDVTRLSRRELRPHRAEVSIVFQDPAGSLDPRMLVGDVVAEPLRLAGGSRLSRRARQQRVSEALAEVGLRDEVARRYPHELSGGQRQRVSIARALISSPALLIADEPTSALDVSVQASVLNLLADLQRDIGFACLFITHNLAAVEYLADQIAVMYLGKLMETGSREQIFARPAHPYTQALLAAAPVADPVRQRAQQKVLLGDDMPSALDPPSGCVFRTRCPLAFEKCALEVPPPVRIGDGEAACHLVQADGTRPDVRTGAHG
ncbi:ABC transporter ATP-binding protein [Actinoplanes sp. TBRC 11911]|uniref:ABC transporter ATP-binding protein n=1 Tax=Actinoplanes sp. TBRC 11911 TaxID=2729386 RepID=UPI001B7D5295|nr:oligopeptide/dipeptide ABC transporter ATP-binding protein [Actinoplanes sp. TBRC 11911]